jgi:hypothetical protein
VRRATLIRLAVKLYPEPIRERYGAEVTDLLAGSTRLWRDLADVARCALGEWLAMSTWADLRCLAWLVAAPFGFVVATVFVAAGPGTLVPPVANYAGIASGDTAFFVVLAMCAALICAEAIWFGRRLARSFVAPTVTVPVALALGTVAMHVVVGYWYPVVLPALAWCAAMIALGLLRRRMWVLVAGGVAVPALSSVLYVAAGAEWSGAPVLLAILTMCSAFNLAVVTAVDADRRRAGTSAPRRPAGG